MDWLSLSIRMQDNDLSVTESLTLAVKAGELWILSQPVTLLQNARILDVDVLQIWLLKSIAYREYF